MKTKFYILYVFIASTSLMYSQVRLGGGGDPVGILRDFCCLYRWIFKQHDLTIWKAISTGEEESFFHIQI